MAFQVSVTCTEQDRTQGHPRSALEKQPDNAERGAAEGEGVLGAGGLLVDGPEAGEGVELVGERDGDGEGRGGDGVGGAEGRVVLGGGGGDGGGLPCPLRRSIRP